MSSAHMTIYFLSHLNSRRRRHSGGSTVASPGGPRPSRRRHAPHVVAGKPHSNFPIFTSTRGTARSVIGCLLSAACRRLRDGAPWRGGRTDGGGRAVCLTCGRLLSRFPSINAPWRKNPLGTVVVVAFLYSFRRKNASVIYLISTDC